MKHEFKIGETVKIKGVQQVFLISEIITVTCSAGTQTLYDGFVLMPKYDSYADVKEKKDPEYYMDKKDRFNEVLLEKI